MTRDEALSLLGLPENATTDAVQARYGEVYNDHQLRLTNAPTPNLKKLYQKNLEEVNEALQVLLGGSAGAVLKELPSSAPVYDAGGSTPPPARTAAQRPAAAKGKSAAKQGGASWGLVTGLGIGLVAGITAAAYFGLRHLDDQKELDGLRPLTAQVQQLEQRIAEKKERFVSGKLKLRNTGTRPFKLLYVIATYADAEGHLKKFEDTEPRNLEVRGGSTVEPTLVDGGRVIWDGSAVAFSFVLDIPGQTCPITHSGILSNELKDGSVNLNFDGW